MYPLISTLFIVILINGKQLKNDTLYRASVFSIVGICYFSVIHYAVYWSRIFPGEEWVQHLLVLAAVLGAIGIALSPWNKKSHPAKTAFFLLLFAVSLTITYGFDIETKEWLAEKGGFFSSEMPISPVQSQGGSPKRFEMQGLRMNVHDPDSWKKYALDIGHEYLRYSSGGVEVIEVRPRCAQGQKLVDTPTYIFNMLRRMKVAEPVTAHDYRCSQSGRVKECLVKVAYSEGGTARQWWHWTKSIDDEQSVTLDMIMFDNDAMLEDRASELIASAQIMTRPETLLCNTPAAWL